MDPNQTLAEAVLHLCEGDTQQAHYRLTDLLGWLEEGGFTPDPQRVADILKRARS